MMRPITDCKDRCACYVDDETGAVEHEYKRVKTKTKIPVGGEYTIERDTTVTILIRTENIGFEVTSYEIAA